jgi:hypothetical protein
MSSRATEAPTASHAGSPVRVALPSLPLSRTLFSDIPGGLGASALIGLGVYSYFSGRHQLRQQEAAIVRSGSVFGMGARRAGISGIAAVLVGMGLWRLVN